MNALRDIYFYNAFKLASEIRSGTLTEYRAVKHLVASMIIGGIGFELPISVEFGEFNMSYFENIGGFIMFIVVGVITYYGVWLNYQVNSKGDGKDFFLRFSALSLPVTIQLLVLFIGIGFLFFTISFFLAMQLGVMGAIITEITFYVLLIALYLMFFLRMRKYLALAANYSDE